MTNDRAARKFTGTPAVRASIPLWIGLYGPSGAGKTYSALRLARGIQSVCGGKIGVGDTENGRAAHYAGEFEFVRYPFDPPFDPLSYLELIDQMASDGISIAIIDSASHEHEGQGGVLEMHEAECERLAKQWKTSREKVQMSAWAGPKADRRRMIQGALRSPMHIIWCFRAKEKLEVRPGKQPVNKGFMPLGAEELVYEMAMTALLMPGAKGHPTWKPGESGERMMVKLPHWAQAMLRDGHPLDEHLGAELARWADGDKPRGQISTTELATAEECAEFVTLFEGLSTEGVEGEALTKIRRVVSKTDDVHKLARPRVLKGIEIMRRAVAQSSSSENSEQDEEETR